MIHRYCINGVFFSICFILFSCSKSSPEHPTIYTIPPPVTGKTYSADEITAFKQLTINVTNGIIKLPDHASVYLVDTGYSYINRELDSIIREVNQLLDTNLVIKRTTERAGATLQVYLTDRTTYIAAEPSAAASFQNAQYTGLTHLDWDYQNIIYQGSVFVDMDRTASDTLQQRYLIHHEMMHALGFYGHVNLSQIYTTLFSYTLTPYILDYTAFDKKMMQLLYNPAIKAGMNEQEFNAAVSNL